MIAVRASRPASPPALEPDVPRWLVERERLPSGRVVDSMTVFPIGPECPFACVHCDLWRHTTGPRRGRPGSLPRQLGRALGAADAVLERPPGQVKVYNASNFFEERAVPPEDDAALLELLAPFPRVVVECHPRWIDERCFRFAASLPGRLQVAIGLETAHPEALARLGKAMTLERFDRAVEALTSRGIGARAFVLLGAPFVLPGEAVEWTVRSVRHALERGVEHVAIVPLRGGNGTVDELAIAGLVASPTLGAIEEAFDRSLELARTLGVDGVVTVDLWDLDDGLGCAACRAPRLARLAQANLGGCLDERIVCPDGCNAE